MINHKRVCNVIEGLCLIDESNKSLQKIYRIVHLVGKCKNKHPKWREEFVKIEKWLVKENIIREVR